MLTSIYTLHGCLSLPCTGASSLYCSFLFIYFKFPAAWQFVFFTCFFFLGGIICIPNANVIYIIGILSSSSVHPVPSLCAHLTDSDMAEEFCNRGGRSLMRNIGYSSSGPTYSWLTVHIHDSFPAQPHPTPLYTSWELALITTSFLLCKLVAVL